MLSPNARNLVRDSCGIGGVTVTVNAHEVDAFAASVAVHCTVAAPTANAVPDARVQLTSIGSTPPVVAGALNVTGTAAPVVEATVTLAGHAIVSGGRGGTGVTGGGTVGGGVGLVGDEHAAITKRLPTSVQRTRRGTSFDLDDTAIRGPKIVLRW
jgi:hypothetical protein